MDRTSVVALGEKDRKQPSLGERVRSHFYNNRGAYLGALGTVASAAAGVYGLHRGLERGNRMVARANEAHAASVDRIRHEAYGLGLGHGMAENMTRKWGPPAYGGSSHVLRDALARR